MMKNMNTTSPYAGMTKRKTADLRAGTAAKKNVYGAIIAQKEDFVNECYRKDQRRA